MHRPHIFSDPTGRRKLVIGILLLIGVTVAVIFGSAFFFSVVDIPVSPPLGGLFNRHRNDESSREAMYSSRRAPVSDLLLERYRTQSLKAIEGTEPPGEAAVPEPKGTGAGKIVAAFYAPWQPAGLNSLRSNADKLTHVMPEWLHLTSSGDIDFESWNVMAEAYNEDFIRIARSHGVQICPILNNYSDSDFDPERVHQLFDAPPLQQKVAESLRDWLKKNGFQGLNLDFENLRDEDYPRLAEFTRRLAGVLHEAGLSLSVDAEAGQVGSERFAGVVAASDFVILMAYDEHGDSDSPGPIASLDWTSRVLIDALKSIPRSKLVLGLGSYGYDWTMGEGNAESISFQSALLRLRLHGPEESAERALKFDADTLNPRFAYSDDEGRYHKVWLLDGVTAFNQWTLGRKANVRGAAVWMLGSEDPSIWSILDKRVLFEEPSTAVLEKITFPYEIEFVGQGEILSVQSEPTTGTRRLVQDPTTHLYTNEEYVRFPSSFVIQRKGYHPRWIALTFDDGPSAEFTPSILKALKDLGVPGTFFMVGENVVSHPDIVRQIWQLGHEIGNHTFTHANLAASGDQRVLMELNTTKRAFQSILGRSTYWFRAPYQADAEPSCAEEVHPLLLASQLGYVTVGELIDPQDWNLWKVDGAGNRVPRTVEEMTASLFQQLATYKANMILLHDAGGDRSRTVSVLRHAVPRLKAEGYRFVRVSDLLGLSREDVNPVVKPGERLIAAIDWFVFEVVFTGLKLLGQAFVIAIALGIARVIFVTTLALVFRVRSRRTRAPADYRPIVSVIVPAYNEGPVVARTVSSILANDYSELEVLVVDDGSTDGTADAIDAQFESEARVRVIRQANAGKATALNNGVSRAAGEIIVGLDADTQFATNTISLLVQHFVDPRVGAVAGNVKVGNRINLLTRWQAVEYITSQNVDRLAYSVLNAVTVVPGAVGAWRRKALDEVGGYVTDTLAEDMDLTWRLRRQGWKIQTESGAVAFTEAPATVNEFLKQRFRWSFGTLQCLWKHRGALFRYGWFGWVGLPTLWLFQIVFQALAPLVDLQLLYAGGVFASSWINQTFFGGAADPAAVHIYPLILQTVFFYCLFYVVELVGAAVAVWIDGEDWRLLRGLFLQRFAYRQLMYVVLWKSLLKALAGTRTVWGKLKRLGTVKVQPTSA